MARIRGFGVAPAWWLAPFIGILLWATLAAGVCQKLQPSPPDTPPQILTVPVEGGRCHVLVEGGQQKPLGCWREWPPVVGQGGGRALEPGPVLR